MSRYSKDKMRPTKNPSLRSQGQGTHSRKGSKSGTKGDQSATEEAEEGWSLRDVWLRFGTRTSMQGVPYIVTSRSRVLKAVWTLLLLISITLLALHLTYLFHSFFSYQKQTQVSLGFSSLQFPAVTFCHVNPVRQSRVNLASSELQELLGKMRPSAIVQMMKDAETTDQGRGRARRSADILESSRVRGQGFSTEKTSTFERTSTSDLRATRAPSMPARPAVQKVTRPSKFVTSTRTPRPLNVKTPSDVTSKQSATSRPKKSDVKPLTSQAASLDDMLMSRVRLNPCLLRLARDSNVSFSKGSCSSSSSRSSIGSSSRNSDDSGGGTAGSVANSDVLQSSAFSSIRFHFVPKQAKGGTPIETNVRSTSSDSTKSTDKEDAFSPPDFTQGGRPEVEVNPLASSSVRIDIMKQFYNLYSKESRRGRFLMGHQLGDMLIDCSLGGRQCSALNFTAFLSTTFGVCYSLEHPGFISQRSGPMHGLQMLVYLQNRELLEGVTAGHGGQVVIHEQNTFPFPDNEGVALPAGMEINIGIKLNRLQRLGGNYGNCHEGQDFLENRELKYTRQTCQVMCEQNHVIDRCGCYNDEYHQALVYIWHSRGLKPCRTETARTCMVRAERKFQNGNVHCDCADPCEEIQYSKSFSSRQWPSTQYASVLVEAVCRQLGKEECVKLQAMSSDELRNNFMKINIYYEDLNYQNITEEADYGVVQFVSDIGGTVGLWLGLSILSLFEVCEFLLEASWFLCCCLWRRDRSSRDQSRQPRRSSHDQSRQSRRSMRGEDNFPPVECGDVEYGMPSVSSLY